MSDRLDYVIKLVHPEWVVDAYRQQRIGFSARHRKQVESWPINGKMLMYLTAHQLMVAAIEVTGTPEHGEKLTLPSHPDYPMPLPVRMLHEGTGALPLVEIRRVATSFTPSKDMSYWPSRKGV